MKSLALPRRAVHHEHASSPAGAFWPAADRGVVEPELGEASRGV